MEEKFKNVVVEYSEKKVTFGDDQIIQDVLADNNIEISELNKLSEYLKLEYKRTLITNEKELNQTIELLQYGVNFIQEAIENNYKVDYKSKYIQQLV